MMRSILLVLSVLLFSCFQQADQHSDSLSGNAPLDSLWGSGKAEINTFKVIRNRYGENRASELVMLFVSEPFSKSKQVKLDDYKAAGDDYLEVVKMNMTEKFQTGIYPYSIMLSTFNELYTDKQQMLKSTLSIQEWCGHAFSQVNFRRGKYDAKTFSYFESAGDTEIKLTGYYEDGIWNDIRLGKVLPTGNFSSVPSLIYSRLKHVEIKPYEAKGELKQEGDVNEYTLTYPALNRKLVINYSTSPTVKILAWEESVNDHVIVKAELINQFNIDYWQYNAVRDSVYLDSLKLH